MTKKGRKPKRYSPKESELRDYRYCLKKGVAFVLEKNLSGSFYIKRLFLNKDLVSSDRSKDSYLRIDTSKSDRKQNRKTFKEYDGSEKVFELYKSIKGKI